jgi:hypothetical protein
MSGKEIGREKMSRGRNGQRKKRRRRNDRERIGSGRTDPESLDSARWLLHFAFAKWLQKFTASFRYKTPSQKKSLLIHLISSKNSKKTHKNPYTILENSQKTIKNSKNNIKSKKVYKKPFKTPLKTW